MGIFQNSYILYFSEAPFALTYAWSTNANYALLANYMAKCQMSSGPYGPIFDQYIIARLGVIAARFKCKLFSLMKEFQQ